MNSHDSKLALSVYSLRFKAHDNSGVGNSIGEDLLLKVAPIIEPVLEAADFVVARVAGKFVRSIEKAEGIDVRLEKDVDDSGLL